MDTGYSDIPGNCRADELARRGRTIELSDEFVNLDISMRTCKLLIDNAIVDSVNDRPLNRIARLVKSGQALMRAQQ